MNATLNATLPLILEGDHARAALHDVRLRLIADGLVPYLGAGLLGLEAPSPVPVVPEDVARLLNARTPSPSRIRTNMWSVAQYIDSRKHRRALVGYMADIFRPEAPATAFHRFLARLPVSLIVDSWYDSTLRRAMIAAGRTDFADVQGITRAGLNFDRWFDAYDASGSRTDPDDVSSAQTILYTPHGGVLPAANFLVADSDYVEVLTEIDIQTPIPDVVKQRRTTRGFLFLGTTFHDQMLRTYARQIMKRSEGPHFAVADVAAVSKNELKFYAQQGITVIDLPLSHAVEILVG